MVYRCQGGASSQEEEAVHVSWQEMSGRINMVNRSFIIIAKRGRIELIIGGILVNMVKFSICSDLHKTLGSCCNSIN